MRSSIADLGRRYSVRTRNSKSDPELSSLPPVVVGEPVESLGESKLGQQHPPPLLGSVVLVDNLQQSPASSCAPLSATMAWSTAPQPPKHSSSTQTERQQASAFTQTHPQDQTCSTGVQVAAASRHQGSQYVSPAAASHAARLHFESCIEQIASMENEETRERRLIAEVHQAQWKRLSQACRAEVGHRAALEREMAALLMPRSSQIRPNETSTSAGHLQPLTNNSGLRINESTSANPSLLDLKFKASMQWARKHRVSPMQSAHTTFGSVAATYQGQRPHSTPTSFLHAAPLDR